MLIATFDKNMMVHNYTAKVFSAIKNFDWFAVFFAFTTKSGLFISCKLKNVLNFSKNIGSSLNKASLKTTMMASKVIFHKCSSHKKNHKKCAAFFAPHWKKFVAEVSEQKCLWSSYYFVYIKIIYGAYVL